jgi:lysophospholipase L1-like esterase
MIGMNDCNENSVVDLPQFKKNLNILADKFAELGTLLIVQTTCPIIPNTSPEREPYFSDYMDAVRNFAEERDLPLIDHEKYWQENPNLLFYRMSNAFHPNAKGHLVFAEKIFKDLDIWDPDSSTCKLFKL